MKKMKLALLGMVIGPITGVILVKGFYFAGLISAGTTRLTLKDLIYSAILGAFLLPTLGWLFRDYFKRNPF